MLATNDISRFADKRYVMAEVNATTAATKPIVPLNARAMSFAAVKITGHRKVAVQCAYRENGSAVSEVNLYLNMRADRKPLVFLGFE